MGRPKLEEQARFLGWREWAPVGIVPLGGAVAVVGAAGGDVADAGEELVLQRVAIWSDEDDFGRTDGFDLGAWRREASDLLQKSRRRRRRRHGDGEGVAVAGAAPPLKEQAAAPGLLSPRPPSVAPAGSRGGASRAPPPPAPPSAAGLGSSPRRAPPPAPPSASPHAAAAALVRSTYMGGSETVSPCAAARFHPGELLPKLHLSALPSGVTPKHYSQAPAPLLSPAAAGSSPSAAGAGFLLLGGLLSPTGSSPAGAALGGGALALSPSAAATASAATASSSPHSLASASGASPSAARLASSTTVPELGLDDAAELGEVATSRCDATRCYRTGFQEQVEARELRLMEQARRKQRHFDKVSAECRQRVVEKGQRRVCMEEATSGGAQHMEGHNAGDKAPTAGAASLRALRLKNVLTRLKGGYLSPLPESEYQPQQPPLMTSERSVERASTMSPTALAAGGSAPGSRAVSHSPVPQAVSGAADGEGSEERESRHFGSNFGGLRWGRKLTDTDVESRIMARTRLRKAVLDSAVVRAKRTRREARRKKRQEARFMELPEAERVLLTEMFLAYANQSGRITSTSRCLGCLFELGLRGSNASERWAVAEVVRSTACGALDPDDSEVEEEASSAAADTEGGSGLADPSTTTPAFESTGNNEAAATFAVSAFAGTLVRGRIRFSISTAVRNARSKVEAAHAPSSFASAGAGPRASQAASVPGGEEGRRASTLSSVTAGAMGSARSSRRGGRRASRARTGSVDAGTASAVGPLSDPGADRSDAAAAASADEAAKQHAEGSRGVEGEGARGAGGGGEGGEGRHEGEGAASEEDANHQDVAASFKKGDPVGIGLEDFCVDIVPAARRELLEERMDMHSQWFIKVIRPDQSYGLSPKQLEELVDRHELNRYFLGPALAILNGSNTPASSEDTSAQVAALQPVAVPVIARNAPVAVGASPPMQAPAAAAADEVAPSAPPGAPPSQRSLAAVRAAVRYRGSTAGRSTSSTLGTATANGSADAATATAAAANKAGGGGAALCSASSDAGSIAGTGSAISEEPTGVDIDDVNWVLTYIEEQSDRLQRSKEREIKQSMDINEELYARYRSELNRFFDLFSMYDSDGSGCLSMEEVKLMMRELGVKRYDETIDMMLRAADQNSNDEFSFDEFVHLMHEVRMYQRSLRRDRLRDAFDRFEGAGKALTPKEVLTCLIEAGLCSEKSEQEWALQFIKDSDAQRHTSLVGAGGGAIGPGGFVGSDGGITFKDVENLAERVAEHVVSQEHSCHIALGKSLGFKASQVAEFGQSFYQFDTDRSGSLNRDEVKKVLEAVMMRPPSGEDLERTFQAIDKDNSGSIGFEEFLHLMKVVGEGKGIFSREPPFTLKNVPEETLREVLKAFQIAERFILNLETYELVETVSNFTGFRSDDNLRELGRPIRNPRQLLERVRTQERERRRTVYLGA